MDYLGMSWDELDLAYARKRGKEAEARVAELEALIEQNHQKHDSTDRWVVELEALATKLVGALDFAKRNTRNIPHEPLRQTLGEALAAAKEAGYV